MSTLYNPDEPKFHKSWRPAMAWSYMTICLFDFMLAPIIYAILNTSQSAAHLQWAPLTLQGGGLYHMSMLAIVGVTAYGRTREKIENGKKSLDMELKAKETEE